MSKLPYYTPVRVRPYVTYYANIVGETVPPEEMAAGGSCMGDEVVSFGNNAWLAIKADHLEVLGAPKGQED